MVSNNRCPLCDQFFEKGQKVMPVHTIEDIRRYEFKPGQLDQQTFASEYAILAHVKCPEVSA